MKKTIFIVDDEFGTVDALTAVLEDVGFQVASALNGEVALEQWRTARPDLVLLDYLMPVLGGCETLKAMKRDPRLVDIPVVLMSGIPESMVQRHCRGYSVFLRKPFGLDTLLAVIDSQLRNSPSPEKPAKKRSRKG